MTKTTDDLLIAAQRYVAAKRAVDEFEGERRGQAFEEACAAWRSAISDLLRSARVSVAAADARSEPLSDKEPA